MWWDCCSCCPATVSVFWCGFDSQHPVCSSSSGSFLLKNDASPGKKRPAVNFFFFGWPSFICQSIRMSGLVCVCVLGNWEAVMPSSSELVSWDQEKGQRHRGPKKTEVEEEGATRECVSAHRPFLSRQTGTLKHSHTCICLCLGWGARTATMLSWQLHKCLKLDTRQFL